MVRTRARTRVASSNLIAHRSALSAQRSASPRLTCRSGRPIFFGPCAAGPIRILPGGCLRCRPLLVALRKSCFWLCSFWHDPENWVFSRGVPYALQGLTPWGDKPGLGEARPWRSLSSSTSCLPARGDAVAPAGEVRLVGTASARTFILPLLTVWPDGVHPWCKQHRTPSYALNYFGLKSCMWLLGGLLVSTPDVF